ncbi:MAG: ABC transporter substrate-binding protein [Candidatus Lambdaproteobacteria bacterium]|nr:ABC transporter substrate-binding protein [Candidatus Lambdaproteobacteria bacterium]
MGRRTWTAMLGIGVLLLLLAAAEASAQKYGGVLRAMLRDDPPALNNHETSAGDTTFSMSPVYSNLVWYDVFKPKETFDTIQPELAESWSWSESNTRLTFRLKSGIRWHDGKPFTSADVKQTYDIVRGVAKVRFKLNPGKLMYFNVQDITTSGDLEVSFKLGRPQPSLLAILAGGRSPVLPAHVDPGVLRAKAMGTGPFRFVTYQAGRQITLERNKDYFVKGRPYLDGVFFAIIKGAGAQNAALIARQVDAAYPIHTIKPHYEVLKAADAGLEFTETVSNGTSNIVVNTQKPPFNNLRLRQAVNLALDRAALIKSVYQGGAKPGGVMIPGPWGLWGLSEEQLATLPGHGDTEKNRAEARRLLAAEGYGPDTPFRIKLSTTTSASYHPPAIWALGELEKVGIIAELDVVDFGRWYQKMARRDFQIAMNATAVAVDDPDAQFYENLKCGAQRNYSDYCNPEMEKRYDRQSMEFDFQKRRAMVQAIDVDLAVEGAKPYLAYRLYYYARQSFVKNWISHNSSYNAWRLQEVWLDK